jgi:nitrate reductase delta subunit
MPDLRRVATRDERVGYQVVSLLLGYPDESLRDRIPELREVVAGLPSALSTPLLALLEHLGSGSLIERQAEYVEVFDTRRRCCLYLTYYAYGDTRKRGQALLSFKQAYRRAGLVLTDGELPDHLAVVLEFAATADLEAGRQLLLDHRAGLELLALALRDDRSPYRHALDAVSATLPRLRGDEQEAVRRLVVQGPPDEEVGLEPFAPPDLMGARR